MSSFSRKFVTEDEVKESRQREQEEWERTRGANDPQERPDLPYDPRPLYQKLREQRMKKKEEEEEKLKFKNQLDLGLDEEEVKFLEEYKQKEVEQEDQKWLEEGQAIREYRKKVEQAVVKRDVVPQDSPAFGKTVQEVRQKLGHKSQSKLLQGIVRRKGGAGGKATGKGPSDVEHDAKRAKTTTGQATEKEAAGQSSQNRHATTSATKAAASAPAPAAGASSGGGLVSYSSDSDSDSDED